MSRATNELRFDVAEAKCAAWAMAVIPVLVFHGQAQALSHALMPASGSFEALHKNGCDQNILTAKLLAAWMLK